MSHLWKHLRLGWMEFWEIWLSENCPCLGLEVRARWSLRSLLTWIILGFCEESSLHCQIIIKSSICWYILQILSISWRSCPVQTHVLSCILLSLEELSPTQTLQSSSLQLSACKIKISPDSAPRWTKIQVLSKIIYLYCMYILLY